MNVTKISSHWFCHFCFSVSFENQVFLNLCTKCLKVETLEQWYKGTLMFCVYIIIRLPWLNLLLWSGAKLRSRGYNRRYRNKVGKKTSFFFFPPWLHLSKLETILGIFLSFFNLLWSILFIYFFKFYFIFKLYNIVLVLPNIEMNLPQVYMCSPSWTLLLPPSPYHPTGSSQCTSPKHPVSCIEPGLVTRFIHDIIHVSMPFS